MADAADHLVTLSDLVSIPMLLKVMNAIMKPVIAVRMPEVDDMMEAAQVKVEAIQKAKEATQGAQPIDQVIFAQNCPLYNLEWQHPKRRKSEQVTWPQ